jgi:hypothetical protein
MVDFRSGEMLSRQSLHELIESLPDAALESSERVLRNFQNWPPKPPIEVEKMRTRVDELFRRPGEERAARTGTGFISSHGFGGRQSL